MSVGSTSMVLAIARPVLYTGAAVLSGAVVGIIAPVAKKVFREIQEEWSSYDFTRKLKIGIVLPTAVLCVGYVFLASSLVLKVVMVASAVLAALFVKIDPNKLGIKERDPNLPQKAQINWDEVLEQINASNIEREATEEDLFEQALHEIVPGLFLGGSYVPEKIITCKKGSLPLYTVIQNTIGLTNERAGVQQQEDNARNINFNLGLDTFRSEEEKTAFVQFVAQSVRLMDMALDRGENVLVYCQQGKDRSSALLALYLYIKTNEKAGPMYIYNFIKSKRPIAEFAFDERQSYFLKMFDLLPEIKQELAELKAL